jgi:hypothetical protein
MAPLAELGRVIAYDRPAFGLTSRPMPESWKGRSPYGYEAQVDLLVDPVLNRHALPHGLGRLAAAPLFRRLGPLYLRAKIPESGTHLRDLSYHDPSRIDAGMYDSIFAVARLRSITLPLRAFLFEECRTGGIGGRPRAGRVSFKRKKRYNVNAEERVWRFSIGMRTSIRE